MLPPIDELMAMTSDELDALKQREYVELMVKCGHPIELYCLQVRINNVIYLAPNKLSAALKIKSLMNNSVCDLSLALNNFTGVRPNE